MHRPSPAPPSNYPSSIREISIQVVNATKATTVAVSRSDQARATIANLAQAVARVGQVTTLISEIASQTNLAGLECDDRGGARRRCRQGLCRGR